MLKQTKNEEKIEDESNEKTNRLILYLHVPYKVVGVNQIVWHEYNQSFHAEKQ